MVPLHDGGVFYSNVHIGNWFSPTTTGIGSSYWLRLVLNSTTGSSDIGSNVTTWPLKPATSGSTTWGQITSDFTASVSCTSVTLNRSRQANITIQIATDSNGSNIVASGTYVLSAASIIPN